MTTSVSGPACKKLWGKSEKGQYNSTIAVRKQKLTGLTSTQRSLSGRFPSALRPALHDPDHAPSCRFFHTSTLSLFTIVLQVKRNAYDAFENCVLF